MIRKHAALLTVLVIGIICGIALFDSCITFLSYTASNSGFASIEDYQQSNKGEFRQIALVFVLIFATYGVGCFLIFKRFAGIPRNGRSFDGS